MAFYTTPPHTRESIALSRSASFRKETRHALKIQRERVRIRRETRGEFAEERVRGKTRGLVLKHLCAKARLKRRSSLLQGRLETCGVLREGKRRRPCVRRASGASVRARHSAMWESAKKERTNAWKSAMTRAARDAPRRHLPPTTVSSDVSSTRFGKRESANVLVDVST